MDSLPFVSEMSVKPMGLGNPVMEIAWMDFIRFAAARPDFVTEFQKESGATLATDPLGSMIDQATGKAHSVVVQFAEWVTKNHWGIEGEPDPEQADNIRNGMAQ